MRSFTAFFASVLLSTAAAAQPVITITAVGALPSNVDEASGLEMTQPNSLWSHNDSGGLHRLYNVDSSGTLVRTLNLSNTTNTDWEELASDSAGNMYVGDFGNNSNDRQDLVIYKIPNPDSVSGNSVTAQAIYFSYPDQSAFPPAQAAMNFDMEAMIAVNDSLYLFSKNRTTPYNGYSKLYRLPTVPGTYVAQLVDSFYTGPGPLDDYSFTGADISSGNDSLVLISHFRIWLFTGFSGADFFGGTSQEYIFSGLPSHKEGVCFDVSSGLYLVDEYTGPGTQNLYRLYFPGPLNTVADNRPAVPGVFPQPFSGKVNVTGNWTPGETVRLLVTDIAGHPVLSETTIIPADRTLQLSLADVAQGIYVLEVFSGEEERTAFRLLKTASQQ